MPASHDMHKLARRWFRQKVRLGELPLQVIDGQMRGLIFYPVSFGDREQWLTVVGLSDPLEGIRTNDRTWVAEVSLGRLQEMQQADEREQASRQRRRLRRLRRRRED